MIRWLRGGALVGALTLTAAAALAVPAHAAGSLTLGASYGGIGTLAGTQTLSGVNHLQMVWDSEAMSQVATWLN